MPTIFRWRGYRFLFYSLDEGEPPHIHVVKNEYQAKFWLGNVRLERSVGFKDHELNRIERVIKEHREEFLEAWNEYFDSR